MSQTVPSADPAAGPLERARELVEDLSFAAVRRWKEAHPGGLAVGHLPVWVPRPLLEALGCLPVELFGGGEEVEIVRGDSYFQSYICHLPRSTVELGLNGAYDALDGLIFPAICDVIRNLSGMWQMLFPRVLVHYLDVPQNFDPAIGGAFYRCDLEALSAALVERGARPLAAEALRQSIALYNENRRLVRELYALRRREPWKVPTHELYVVLRAALLLPVEDSTPLFAEYLALTTHDESRRPQDQARVLVTGSFCEQPPLALIKTLERSGCYIVDDDFVQVHRFIGGDIPVDGDPLQRLVDALLTDAAASPTRYIGDGVKGAELEQRVAASRAEGVLFCAPSFCDPALLDQPMAVRAAERAGVPWTAFKYAENSGQFQVIREQAGTFADSIKLWSNA